MCCAKLCDLFCGKPHRKSPLLKVLGLMSHNGSLVQPCQRINKSHLKTDWIFKFKFVFSASRNYGGRSTPKRVYYLALNISRCFYCFYALWPANLAGFRVLGLNWGCLYRQSWHISRGSNTGNRLYSIIKVHFKIFYS